MVKKFLRNIRQKPKSVRDNIALGIAGIFTAVVALVWMYHVPYRMSTLESAATDDDTPAFGDLFSGIKDQLATVSELQKSTSTTATEALSTTSLVWSGFSVAADTATVTTFAASGTEPVAVSSIATATSSYVFATITDPVPTSQSIRIVTVSASATATTTGGQ